MKLKIDKEKVKKALLRFFGVFWKNLFLTFAVLIFIAILASVFVFWNYYIQREETEARILPTLNINQPLLDDFLAEWDARQNDFDSAFFKEHQDPFSGVLFAVPAE